MTKATTKKSEQESAATTDNASGLPANAGAATSGGTTPAKEPATAPVVIDLSKPVIKDAIAKGLAIIKEGKTKADAARAMYDTIKAEPKEVIVAAFVQGATLTEKGALTYWYNCKRKAAKAPKQA